MDKTLDSKEPVRPIAGTFVMIVGALVTERTPVMIKLDHNRSCPWV